jgi:ATP-dependent exoDNAse (exonuclease V) beta subunit
MPHQDWQHLSRIHHHPRDDRIYFVESTHTYYVDGSSEGNISTTKFIHSFFPHFDAKAIIQKMMKSPKWPQNKNYGKTEKQIMDEWNANGKQASEAGTAMHLAIEQFLHGSAHLISEEMKHTAEWRYFQQFWNDCGKDLEPYRMEWEVWTDPSIKLTGSIDGVFRRKSDGKFLIYDWKRCKDIKSDNPFGTGLPPVDHLPDTNYWHYTLQLNVYKWILETYYNLEVADLFLVILHPENKSYKRMRLNILADEVSQMIDARKRAVADGCKQAVILPIPAEHHDADEDDEPVSNNCLIRT